MVPEGPGGRRDGPLVEKSHACHSGSLGEESVELPLALHANLWMDFPWEAPAGPGKPRDAVGSAAKMPARVQFHVAGTFTPRFAQLAQFANGRSGCHFI
jgi:hypothetical protein